MARGHVALLLNILIIWMAKVGPELKSLMPGFRPLTDMVTATAPRIDLGSLIHQALHETGDDSIKVRVTVK